MSEVSDIAIKRTQDSLGKVIKKPVLTEKLLRKPPFKFLHDIIHAVSRFCLDAIFFLFLMKIESFCIIFQ